MAKIKEGKSIKLRTRTIFSPTLYHVDHILENKASDKESEKELIVLRYYGKTKQWWHYMICSLRELQTYNEELNLTIIK